MPHRLRAVRLYDKDRTRHDMTNEELGALVREAVISGIATRVAVEAIEFDNLHHPHDTESTAFHDGMAYALGLILHKSENLEKLSGAATEFLRITRYNMERGA